MTLDWNTVEEWLRSMEILIASLDANESSASSSMSYGVYQIGDV